MIIGYTRVSSIDQNLESHLKILKAFGAEKYLQKNIHSKLFKKQRIAIDDY
ncbi:conserved hypothetical protein [Staphylococcus capitis]|nr:conserved hypothetical protein [Staphylococcus capitis CR01]CQD26095.1 conserved hypothetical protein [Staphylococcus capitis]CQD27644.1 conserved hypothetical protein [Staphylococcus capitis]CQD31326.1 conserved hypothetical protein [Staphylococcus capitis]CRN11712.1 conserved hypothetical protein [Staphylococcus capitis]